MKLKVIAVRDSPADAYMPPSFVHNTGQAIREFGDICKDPNHQFSKHPEDYELFYLGEWDDQDGTFDLVEHPRSLARGADFNQVQEKYLSPVKLR